MKAQQEAEKIRTMLQSRQDRAGATQQHHDTIALYTRQIRDLEAELEAANGYIRSLESRCAMQARQLGYG